MDSHLDQNLTLEDLAREACFSPYHFHRVFYSYVGERPFEMLQRLRLEKAAHLIQTRRSLRMIDIAYQCGFQNAAAFSRAFKLKFEKTPTQWRTSCADYSNFSTGRSNLSQERSPWIPYIKYNQGVQTWRMRKGNEERTIEVRPLDPMEIAYVRYTGTYKGDGRLFHKLWNDLTSQAGALDLINPQSQYLALYHDSPELTPQDQLRVTIGVSVTGDFPPTESLGRMTIPGGKYAFGQFYLNSSEYQEAWDWMYRHWLPQSGYVPGDLPSFELFPQEQRRSSDGRYPVVICIPLAAV